LVIPIILRSLAGTFPVVEEDSLPLGTDPGLLETLDSGKHQLVKNYELRWWTGRKPRDLLTVEILNKSTVKKCLDHFREQLALPWFNTKLPAGAGAGIPSDDSRSSPRLGAGVGVLGTSAPVPRPGSLPRRMPLNAGPGDSCQNCFKMRKLLSDVLQDIQKYQNFSSVMSTSSENLLNIGIRRASTFYLLHEAALLKETGNASLPAKTSTLNIADVIRNASTELNRLKGLPPSSYKWTWGETLTEKEVLNLRRTGTCPGHVPHSGYDISLADGKPKGVYSSDPTSKFPSTGQYDDVPVDDSFIPPTELHFPKYFSQPDHRRIYDPFQLSNPPVAPAPGSPSPGDIAGLWPSGAGSDMLSGEIRSAPVSLSPGSVADNWPSGADSESDSGEIPPAPESPSPGSIADKWSSGSESPSPDNIAENWSSGPGSVANSLSRSVDIAELWTSGASNAHIEDTLHLTDVEEILQLAEVGEDDGGYGNQRGSRAPTTDSRPDPASIAALWTDDEDQAELTTDSHPDPASIAALWTDDETQAEHSGDELATPSYAYPAGIRNEVTVSGETPTARSYGPDDFSFLEDKMFDFDM